MSTRKSKAWIPDDAADRRALGPLNTGVVNGDIALQRDIRQPFEWDEGSGLWKWVSPLGGSPGVPSWGDVAFKMDAGDPACLSSSVSPVTQMLDLAGKTDNDLITFNAVTLVDSHFTFNGSDSVITLADTRSPDTKDIFNGTGSISFWMRAVDGGEANSGNIIDTRTAGVNQGYTIEVTAPGPGSPLILRFIRDYSVANGTWTLDLTSFPVQEGLPVDTWIHVALTFTDVEADGTPGSVPPPLISIDGVRADQVTEATTPNGTPTPDDGNLNIGNRNGGDRTFNGNIDILTMWRTGLSATEAMQDYAATRPRYQGGTGFQLLDRAVATANTTSFTLNGLDSARDGIYFVTGKIIQATTGQAGIIPVTGSAISNIKSTITTGAPTGTNTLTTSSWLVGSQLTGDGGDSWTTFFQAWIWPALQRHGASASGQNSARLFRSTGVGLINAAGTAPTWTQDSWGTWYSTAPSDTFNALTVTGFTANALQQGSEVSVYKLGYGTDPI